MPKPSAPSTAGAPLVGPGGHAIADSEMMPAGWYRDTVNEKLHRYWDGLQWRSETGEYPQQRGLAQVEGSDPRPTRESRPR